MTEMHADTVIAAEDAPIGVQLWPTIHPQYAPNFRLAEVITHRNAVRTWVEWIYESGKTRSFELGEPVACRLPI